MIGIYTSKSQLRLQLAQWNKDIRKAIPLPEETETCWSCLFSTQRHYTKPFEAGLNMFSKRSWWTLWSMREVEASSPTETRSPDVIGADLVDYGLKFTVFSVSLQRRGILHNLIAIFSFSLLTSRCPRTRTGGRAVWSTMACIAGRNCLDCFSKVCWIPTGRWYRQWEFITSAMSCPTITFFLPIEHK